MEKQSFIETNKKELIEAFNETIQPPLDYENHLIQSLQHKLDNDARPKSFFRPLIWAAASVAILLGTLTLTSIRPPSEQELAESPLLSEPSSLLAADDLFDFHLIEVFDAFDDEPAHAEIEDDPFWYDYTFDELIELNINS